MPKLRDDEQQLPMPSNPSDISWTVPSRETPKNEKRSTFIRQRARLLLGAYRRDAAADPESYLTTIAIVLARYSDALIIEATDPLHGIPSQERWRLWPPTSGELRAWLEDRLTRTSSYQQRVERQLAERDELQRLHDSIPAEERRAHVIRVEDALAERGIYTSGWRARQRAAEVARTREAMRAAGQAVPADALRRLLTWAEAEAYRAQQARAAAGNAAARAAAGEAAKAAHAADAAEGGKGGGSSE